MTKTDRAALWLLRYLASGEPVESQQVLVAARAAGYPKNTLHRAKAKLPSGMRIDMTKVGFSGPTVWQLVTAGGVA